MGQIQAHCTLEDKECHTKQRQGLLQWAWNSEKHKFSDNQVLNNAKKISSKLGFSLDKKEVSNETLLSMIW